MKKRTFLFYAFLLLMLNAVSAQTVHLQGSVVDSFLKTQLQASITIMGTDSTVLTKGKTNEYLYPNGRKDYIYTFEVPRQNAYIIKAECPGYETGYMNCQLKHKRNNVLLLDDLPLKKKPQDDIYKTDSLDGVVVTATRIKMVMRGDTIVFDASAFNLPEGSMLDNLVKQLPGAELKSNGDIYIQGRKLDYLTLNGKDFFRGKNKVILENLPYYTVDKLKVYNKQTELSEAMGRDVEKRDYVMDVILKRKYNRTWLANIEAAGGTDDRYLLRAFALLMTEHSQLSVFGNLNNINENRTPGAQGDWEPSQQTQGQLTTKTVGLNWGTEGKNRRWRNTLEGQVSWQQADNETRTSLQRFAEAGDVYSRLQSRSREDRYELKASNRFNLMKPFFLGSHTSFSISNSDIWARRRSASFGSDPLGDVIAALDSAYQNDAGMLNRAISETWNRSHQTQFAQTLLSNIRFGSGDMLSLRASLNLNRQRPAFDFDRNETYYRESADTDRRNIFSDRHQQGYTYSVEGSYSIQVAEKPQLTISPALGYTQSLTESHNMNYRLEQLGGEYAESLSSGFHHRDMRAELLPSTQDSLLTVLDLGSSRRYSTLRKALKAGLNAQVNTKGGYVMLFFDMERSHERMNYHALTDTTVSRTRWQPHVRLNSYMQLGENYYQFWNIEYRQQLPDLASLMPLDDTLNPLARRLSNPHLKATRSLTFDYTGGLSWSRGRRLTLTAQGQMTGRAIGTRTRYNSRTGAYTFQPDNVNGNSDWQVGANYVTPLDSARRFTLTTGLNTEYLRSVDFAIAYDDAPIGYSHVHNLYNTVSLKLDYTLGKLSAGLGGRYRLRHSESPQQGFSDINAHEYDYGMTLNYELPLRVSLATDLRVYGRRGYDEPSMNTDDVVWNASLSRAFMKGRLVAKLTTFDLLHQLRNTTYTVNAQGRTETWRNSIPRYVMFSLSYRLGKK